MTKQEKISLIDEELEKLELISIYERCHDENCQATYQSDKMTIILQDRYYGIGFLLSVNSDNRPMYIKMEEIEISELPDQLRDRFVNFFHLPETY